MIPASIEGFEAFASRNGSAEMDENTRSRRDPGDIDPDDIRNGHGTGDANARRTSRSQSDPEQKPETEKQEPGGSVRTTRDGSPVRTSSDRESEPRSNTRETGNRTTIPGNTSETGAGSPTPESTGTPRTTPQLPGMPAGGCTRTAGTFLITSVGLATFVAKMLRR